jgi:hypothetical protein
MAAWLQELHAQTPALAAAVYKCASSGDITMHTLTLPELRVSIIVDRSNAAAGLPPHWGMMATPGRGMRTTPASLVFSGFYTRAAGAAAVQRWLKAHYATQRD